MTKRPTYWFAAAVIALASLAVSANAQSIGTFSWQTQPYCNVVTVQVIQQGPLYQLVGSDNLCGAGTAPITGTAVPAGGSVVFGMTAALPNGRAAHLSATVPLATISGTWSDGDGNTGAFAFNGGAAGAPRPAPASTTAITVNQLSPTVYAGTGAATTVARSDHDHDTRYYTKAESDALRPAATFSAPPPAPTIDASGSSKTVTTTRAGQVQIQLSLAFSGVTCAAGTPGLYLQLDGAPLLSSAIFSSNFSGYLIGTTAGVIPPGVHDVGWSIDCPNGPVTGGAVTNFSLNQATVIVLP